MFNEPKELIEYVAGLKQQWAGRDKAMRDGYKVIRLFNDLEQDKMESVIGSDPRTGYNMALWLLKPRTWSYTLDPLQADDDTRLRFGPLVGACEREVRQLARSTKGNMQGSVIEQVLKYLLATGWLAVISYPTPDGWDYGFTKPAQCKRIVKVAGSETPSASEIDYLDFGGRILTDSETTWLDYVDGTKIDSPGMWSEVFAGAVAAQLAYKVCPITGTSTDKRDMLAKDARRLMSLAKLWDAQQNGAFPIPPGEYEKARAGFSRRYNG